MTDGNTYAINKHLDDREDYDALQEVTAELEQAEARVEELEGMLARAEATKGAQQLLNYYAAEIASYGATIARLRNLEDAWANLKTQSEIAELSSVSCANSKGQDDE